MNFKKLMQAQLSIMQGLHEAAISENRELTADEQTKYDAAKTEFNRLKALQEQQNELNNFTTSLLADESGGPPDNNSPPAAHMPAPVASSSRTVRVGDNLGEGQVFKNFGTMLMHVVAAKRGDSEAYSKLKEAGCCANPKDALQTGTGQEGGFLVPPQFIGDLMAQAEAESQLYSRVNKIPFTAGNSVNIPGVDETSRADGSRWGGIQFSWVVEGQSGTYTYPKFRNLDLKLGKLVGLTVVTEELLQDATALEAWVKMAFPAEMAFSLDQAIFDGDGNGKPLGFQSASNVLVSVAKEGSQTADTVVFQNVIKMWARMPFLRQKNAIWLITPQVQEQLPQMNLSVGTGGSAVYLPAGGAADTPYQRLFGRPVIAIEQAAKLGDKGDISLVDLSDYIVIEKGGIRQESSIHVFFDADKTAFRFVKRVNGAPYTRKSVESRADSTFKMSPYITLAARA